MPVTVPAPVALVAVVPGTRANQVDPDARHLWPGSDVLAVPLPDRGSGRRLALLRRRPGVRHVERALPRRAVAHGTSADELLSLQTYLPAVRWDPPPVGGIRPLVAVLDTGVEPVPDLASQIRTDLARSFVRGRDPLDDPEGHGTHVAGIVAASVENGIGIAGMADAQIVPITVADASGGATTASLVAGLRYAVSRRVRIVNISFAGPGYSEIEQEAIDAAARAGVLVVAAAGNSGSEREREYPAAYRHVLAVGAVDAAGTRLAISTSGPQIGLVAPGADVVSTAPGADGNGAFTTRIGTSASAPIVAGAAARLMAARPTLGAPQVRDLLERTARDLPPIGPDDFTGRGLLDLRAALAAPALPPDSAEPNDDPGRARRLPAIVRPRGRTRAVLSGTLRQWSDPRDVRTVVLRRGERVRLELAGPSQADLDLRVWRPGAPPRAGEQRSRDVAWIVAQSLSSSSTEKLELTGTVPGGYAVEVRLARGTFGRYRLRVARVPAVAGPLQDAQPGAPAGQNAGQ